MLTWCPTCTKNFDELEKDVEAPSFDLGHISEFLAANLDALKARFVATQPRRRVVIHEHLGIGATVASIAKLLRAVPNLELLELEQDSGFSYACGGQAAKFKEREQAIHRRLAEGAVAAGADTIVTMYHSCHRALAGAEAVYPLKVVNFTDVIAEALGRGGHPDYYRLYKAGGAMDEAVAAARTLPHQQRRADRRGLGAVADRRHLQRDRPGRLARGVSAGLHGAGARKASASPFLHRQHRPGGVGEEADVVRQKAGEAAIDLVGRGLQHHADRRRGGEVDVAPGDLARLHRLGDHLAHDGHRIGRVVGHLDQEGVLVQQVIGEQRPVAVGPVAVAAHDGVDLGAQALGRRCASASASASAR